MDIIQDFTEVNFDSGRFGHKIEYIVIHYTGNFDDSAKANANYFREVDRQSSAHYFIDENDIVQVVHEYDTAWAVGVNYGSNNLFNKCKNYNSLSIEMCGTAGKVGDRTFQKTVEVVKALMKKYNVPIQNVVRHYDVCSKQCPGWDGWLPPNETLWKKLKAAVIGNTIQSDDWNGRKTPFLVRVPFDITELYIQKEPSYNAGNNGFIDPGVYTITAVKKSDGYNYGKLKSGVGWIALEYTQFVRNA